MKRPQHSQGHRKTDKRLIRDLKKKLADQHNHFFERERAARILLMGQAAEIINHRLRELLREEAPF